MISLKYSSIIWLFLCISSPIFAQVDEVLTVRNKDGVKVKIQRADVSESCTNAIYTTVAQPAVYKSRTRRLVRNLNKGIALPEDINFEIAIRFLVNCKGEASGFVTSETSRKEVPEQLISAFDELQGWKAGILRNREIDMEVILFVKFKKGRIDGIRRVKTRALGL